MRAVRIGSASLVAVGLLLGPSLVIAQPPAEQPAEAETPSAGRGDQPENIDATREARERFQAGLAHFEARRFREAIHEFELAGQLVPSADLWYNIARAHEELSQYDRAVEYYQRYLRDRVDPPDRERVEAHIRSLEERGEAERQALRQAPTTGTLRITSTVPGALVAVDGRSLGEAPVAAPLSLQPGRHRLSVRGEGYVPFESEVQVEAGVTTAAHADLRRATEYRSVSGGRLFTWITAGLAGASLIASIVFGIKAAGQESDARDESLSMQEQLDMLVDAEDTASVSDMFLGGAVVLGIGSLILWFVEGSSVETERVTPEG
jgi:tetratricopeptide (TPR) repeat protein